MLCRSFLEKKDRKKIERRKTRKKNQIKGATALFIVVS
jgi:hypothetical protein